MAADALAVLVFAPLVAALAMIVAPVRATVPLAVLGLTLPLPALWLATSAVLRGETVAVALAGFAPPLGIVWRADGFSLTLAWLTFVVVAFVSLHARVSFPVASDAGRRFWPLWTILVASLYALFLSADLFNLYVTLELVTLAGVAMIAIGGKPAAMRAAMRYLLLGLMASLFYLLATALLYGQAGTLDLYQVGERMGDGALTVTALALMVTGLLVKAAIVPLHVWLPAAHGNAPGPVSAVLSALVVKVALYILVRLWFWVAAPLDVSAAAIALGVLGAIAIVYGSVAAIVQTRLKMLIAYSTVAQLGYVMLLFPLASGAAFRAVTFHVLAHGVAKAAMFLAAANLLSALGSDRLQRLVGADQRFPVNVLAFALAGVSIMGLPPSGGFVAKWMLLEAAWQAHGWGWVAIVSLGSLLAAVYVFRVVALAYAQPRPAVSVRRPGTSPRGRFHATSLAALGLAVLAVLLGIASAPVLTLVELGMPPGLVTP